VLRLFPGVHGVPLALDLRPLEGAPRSVRVEALAVLARHAEERARHLRPDVGAAELESRSRSPGSTTSVLTLFRVSGGGQNAVEGTIILVLMAVGRRAKD